MVEFANNLTEAVTITVTLDNCTDGTLYGNEGKSGCYVTLNLGAGNTQQVDIEGLRAGRVTYNVSGSSSGFSLDTSGSIEAQAGNVKVGVRIQAPSKGEGELHREPASQRVRGR